MLKLCTAWLGAIGALVLNVSPAAAQTALFTDTAPLQITLAAPFAGLVSAAPHTTNPYPATLTLTNEAGAAQAFQIQIRARGLTRRTGGFCNFPPIGLDFAHGTVHGTLFEGQNKLKLVTYCQNTAPYEQQIVLEYLAYRFYNLVTPQSFRVRATQVIYHDNQSHRSDVLRFGFLIEDIDDVAHRNQRAELKVGPAVLNAAQLEAHASMRFALFEYMIGNQDWTYTRGPPGDNCCHNNRILVAAGATTALVPVPYDFDYSGFVDAPYAVPPAQIPIRDVRTRYFRGLCIHTTEIPAVVEEFRAHHAEMNALIANEAHLSAGTRSRAQNYLDSFFAILDDPARVNRELAGKCRNV